MMLLQFGLAVYFATYVVTRSSFPPVKAARQWIVRRRGYGSATADLVTCPWCSGFWVSVLLVGTAAFVTDVPWPVMMVLACAAIAGLIQYVVDTVGEMIELKAGDK